MTTVDARPEVSVVMGVYNAATSIDATIESVLGQRNCDFEFIVVDDGSTDGTSERLDTLAKLNNRLRVEHQENAGLTEALIHGCALASGEFIARQDAGDVSLPDRLRAQAAFIRAHPKSVMTASAVQFLGPANEELYVARAPMRELDRGIRAETPETVVGPPHHGAVMFRRDAYVQAGGYRAPFDVAQDLDLWFRLAELGDCLGMEPILYLARLEAAGISSRRRARQVELAAVALQCRRVRADGGSDSDLLQRLRPSPRNKGGPTSHERARFNYFIASCMRQKDPEAALAYYRAAWQDNPLHLKAFVRWLTTG